jgi:Flp pilus assembly pilin Flp
MLKAAVFLRNLVTVPVGRDDRGITSVEYALLLAIVAAVIFTALVVFGHKLRPVFVNFQF